MNQLIYNNTVTNVVVCGDIHGAFETMVYKLCVRHSMNNTLLIVAGDCGFGFEKPAAYDMLYNKVADRLKKRNNYVAFVRGNHDDPAYFNEERITYKRWRTVPDYTVISAAGHNILCVGGAISVDRSLRKDRQLTHPYKETNIYWDDEAPVFNPEAIESLSVPIDIVVTHTAPSFCEMQDHTSLWEWAQDDKTLMEDVAKERSTMDDIYKALKEKGEPLNQWFYGHFHQSWSSVIEGVRFKMLDIEEFYEIK